MIKVYGCPACARLEIGSMRKGMICRDCERQMERLPLTFLEFTEMSESERMIYARKWVSGLREIPEKSGHFKVI